MTGTPATGAAASGPTPRAARHATDARRTEVFGAIVPRRLRRRYADDDHDEQPGPSGTGEPSHASQHPADPPPAADAGTDGPTGSDGTDDGSTGASGHAPPDGRPRWLRSGAVVLAVLVLLTTAWGFVGRSQVHDGVRTVQALDTASDAVMDAESQAVDRNVLVVGLQADRGPGVPEAARTDTAVLVHQPAGDAPAVTLALPPTLEVSRPPCRRWDPATGSYGKTVPAESRTAFAAAYDVGGPACTVGVVQQLTGIRVTGFVAHDLAGTAGLVDAVGGVEVCTERPVVDPVLGPVVPAAGRTTLDGDTARRFAAASATADSSPAARVQRQQRVLAAALGDALSTPSLLTPSRPGRAADGLSGSVVADGVSAGQILTLARGLSRAGTAGDGSTPTFLQVPVTDAPNTRGHLEMERSDARDIFSALREHEPLPAEATAPAARSATTAPPDATVDLVDAAGRPGLVDEIAASLRERGYTIGTVTSGPPTTDTEVRYSPDRTDAAGALTEALPAARPAPAPSSSGELEVVVGSELRAPAPAAAADAGTDIDCS
ncbi:LCP family protein [Pseudonocardia nantongensis]|uniref:LCP family protein n=1 Tax=Pseudonocardia nantongensis TaxID=1181885 RepID=UPI00397D3890